MADNPTFAELVKKACEALVEYDECDDCCDRGPYAGDKSDYANEVIDACRPILELVRDIRLDRRKADEDEECPTCPYTFHPTRCRACPDFPVGAFARLSRVKESKT